MSDLISRQAAIDAVEEWEKIYTWDHWCVMHNNEKEKYNITAPSDILRDLPPAEPERKRSHWIDTGSGEECSECHEIQYGYDNFRFFCANCGADMVGSIKKKFFRKTAQKIPKSCANCPNRKKFQDSDLVYCELVHDFVQNFKESRHQHCPLKGEVYGN